MSGLNEEWRIRKRLLSRFIASYGILPNAADGWESSCSESGLTWGSVDQKVQVNWPNVFPLQYDRTAVRVEESSF